MEKLSVQEEKLDNNDLSVGEESEEETSEHVSKKFLGKNKNSKGRKTSRHAIENFEEDPDKDTNPASPEADVKSEEDTELGEGCTTDTRKKRFLNEDTTSDEKPLKDLKDTDDANTSVNISKDEDDSSISNKRLKKDATTDTEVSPVTSKGLGDVVACHYNSIEERGIRERLNSSIFFLRNTNNWLKNFLINQYLDRIRDRQVDGYPITVIDLGCGKGGDLLKWQKGRIRHLICADIAEKSVNDCRDRFHKKNHSSAKLSAEFIVADCTKTRLKNLKQNQNMLADLVSCQFAFHYCFESLEQAETMIRNISENLRPGGYFIATLPNSKEIISRLRASGTNSFGNNVYKISFPEDREENPPLFGDRYNFYLEGVVDCPEFLVDHDTFERICKKYDLQLQMRQDFASLHKQALITRESQKLLAVMNALEIYPSKDQQTQTADGEYDHAAKYLEDNKLKNILTLSKSEWEAISIYMAVAFRKVVST